MQCAGTPSCHCSAPLSLSYRTLIFRIGMLGPCGGGGYPSNNSSNVEASVTTSRISAPLRESTGCLPTVPSATLAICFVLTSQFSTSAILHSCIVVRTTGLGEEGGWVLKSTDVFSGRCY